MERSKALFGFTLVAALFTVCGTLLLLGSEKYALHAALNARHSPALDRFMALFTHMADGLVPTAFSLLLLLLATWRSFLMMGLSCGLSAVVAQFLKHLVFHDADRPAMHADRLEGMHWVLGIDLHHHNSFPSGHATAAFAMMLALSVLLGKPRWGPPLALVAVLMAWTRVYLSQHFLADIVAGAAIGTVTGVVLHHWLYRSSFAQRAWLDRGLLRYRK
jgi:membrane-associated phospholipid phosphatase